MKLVGSHIKSSVILQVDKCMSNLPKKANDLNIPPESILPYIIGSMTATSNNRNDIATSHVDRGTVIKGIMDEISSYGVMLMYNTYKQELETN